MKQEKIDQTFYANVPDHAKKNSLCCVGPPSPLRAPTRARLPVLKKIAKKWLE